MPKYETVAGTVTRAETYSKIIHLSKELEDLFYVMAHLHATEDSTKDNLLATGWRGMGELQARVSIQVTKLAMGQLKQ